MLFIPQEIKEKLAKLEDENKRLETENKRLELELLQPQPISAPVASKNSGLIWLLAVALLAAIGYIIYVHLVVLGKPQTASADAAMQAVILRDGKIEKWNAAADKEIVYRVQIGSYKDFNIDKYKQNLEGLQQDSIDGTHKISLGAFSRLEDAQTFSEEMIRMGLPNVYIVAYKNGQPIGLIEAKKLES